MASARGAGTTGTTMIMWLAMTCMWSMSMTATTHAFVPPARHYQARTTNLSPRFAPAVAPSSGGRGGVALTPAAPLPPRSPRATGPAAPGRSTARQGVVMSLSASDSIAGALFPLSLFPYIAFLYFASYDKNKMPPLALFGFKFLLVFVVGR